MNSSFKEVDVPERLSRSADESHGKGHHSATGKEQVFHRPLPPRARRVRGAPSHLITKERTMSTPSGKEKSTFTREELKKLRGELWIILPFFIFSVYVFAGSFQYKFEARTVPLIIGAGTAILTAMRLLYIFFPHLGIGEFKEGGLGGEFDQMKDEIEEEALKGRIEEPEGKKITFADEKKAFIALIGSFLIFLLLGYIVGTFFVVVGTSYYYGFRNKTQIAISLASMYLVVYIVLYKLLEAPADFGLLLDPILQSFNLL